MIKWRYWFVCSLCLIVFFSVSSSELFAAKPRAGLSLGVGIGGMFANHFNGYRGYPNNFYSELQLVADFAFIRAGISAGMIYRQYEEWNWYFEYHSTEYIARYPIMADFSILPLRFFSPNSPVQIYLGGSAGIILDKGPREPMPCVGPRIGVEYYMGDWAVLNIEGRYIIVPNDEILNYFNAMVSLRIRIPFLKIAK